MKLITAKFVVLRCAYCKLRRDFGFICSVNCFCEVGVNANHNVTCSPSLAEKEIAMVSGFFVKRRRQVLYGGFLSPE